MATNTTIPPEEKKVEMPTYEYQSPMGTYYGEQGNEQADVMQRMINEWATRTDPQAQANHYIQNYEYPDGIKTAFANGPVHFASVDPAGFTYETSKPIGADTKPVLEELGYAPDEIEALYAGGAAK